MLNVFESLLLSVTELCRRRRADDQFLSIFQTEHSQQRHARYMQDVVLLALALPVLNVQKRHVEQRR